MAIEIPLELPGVDKLLDKITGVADGLRGVRTEVKALGADASSATKSIGSGRSGGGSVGKGSGRSLSWSDPWERTSQLQTERAWARMAGESDQKMRGLDLAILRSTKSALRGEKDLNPVEKSDADKLMDALMTSRMAFSGGKMQLMPLVGKMASAGLVDPSKMGSMLEGMGNVSSLIPLVTKLALPAAAVVAGVVGAYQLTESGMAKTRSLGDAFYASGGTGKQTAELAAIGSFIGMSAEQAAEKAISLGDRLRQGGYGAAYMRSRGIIDQGPWTTNKADNYIRSIDELRKIKNDSEATRVARDLGLQDELWVRRLGNRTYNRLKNSIGTVDDDELNAEAKYRAEKAMVGNWWDNVHRTGARRTADLGGRFMERQSGGWWNWIAGIAAYNFAAESINQIRGVGGDAPGGRAEAAREQTNAIRDLTRTMKDSAEKLGGGPRSHGAFPSAWKYGQMDDAMQSGAVELGAFRV